MAKKKEEEKVEEVTEEVKEEKGEVFETPVELLEKRAVYPTGFRNIDTLLAFNEYHEDTGKLQQTNRGILSGSLITYVGVSGAGKTTLAAQNVANMMMPYIKEGNENVKLHMIDNEGGLTRHRFKNLTNLTNEEIHKHVVFETQNSIEFFNELMVNIIQEKKKMKPITVKGYTGVDIEILPPTFIMVDALSEMMPENLTEEEKADNKMMYFTQARLLDQFFKKFKNQFVKYNINMFCIAHMSKKHNLDNPLVRPTKEFRAFPADVKINGGKNFLYNTDIGIFISKIIADSPEALEKKSATYLEAQGIMEAKLWKNRQGRDNVRFYLVSDGGGFNPLKSFIYECVDLKVIETSGSVRKVEGYEEKLRSSQLLDKFYEDDFRKCLYDAYDKRKAYIFEAARKGKEERRKALDILSMMNE